MMRKFCLYLVSAVAFTSCINNEYDLSNFDKTIGSTIDITLPASNEDSIPLANFVDIGNSNSQIDTIYLEDAKKEVFYARANGKLNVHIQRLTNGEQKCTIDTVGFRMDNWPDFLKGSQARFDLRNPMVLADVSNTCDEGQITLDMKLAAKKNDGTQTSIDVTGVDIPHGKSSFCFGQYKQDIPASQLDTATYGQPKFMEEQTRQILKIIPNVISPEITRVVGSGFSKPHYNVDATLNIRLFAPIQTGEGFCLHYTTDAKGWTKSFDDLNLDALEECLDTIIVSALIDNDSPADVDVSLQPMDSLGNVITELPTAKVKVTAGEKNIPFKYVLTSSNSNVSLINYIRKTEGVPQLGGIHFETILSCTAENVGKYLSPDNNVFLHNVRLGLKGKIIYNGN